MKSRFENNRVLGLLIILFLLSGSVNAQILVIRDAETRMFAGKYEEALAALRYLKEQEVNLINLDYRIAICELLSPDRKGGDVGAFMTNYADFHHDPFHQFWNGTIYLRYEHFAQATTSFELFLKQIPKEGILDYRFTTTQALAIHYLDFLTRRGGEVISSADSPLNSYFSEISPVILNSKKLAFTSNRGDEQHFQLMVADGGDHGWQAPVALADLPQNVRIVATNDSDKLVLFDSENLILIDLTFTEGVWKQVASEPMPFLSGAGSLYMNKYQTRILLTRLESNGSTGIYESLKLRSTGTWTEPSPLPGLVNTEWDEAFPFLTEDRKQLYFSSNKPGGLGGMDVYVSTFDEVALTWTTPVNLGLPINGFGDEISFHLEGNGLQGSFSSNRPESRGDFDVFFFRNERLAAAK